MKNLLKYKGFTAKVEFNAVDQVFFGYALGLPNDITLTFDGDTVTALIHDFHNVVDDYLMNCKEKNVQPVTIYSGRILLRIDPETHASAILMAQSENKSLNTWINDIVIKSILSD